VTPLRDGMNLVAKEYVASQDPEDPGVLVLSRFAGAAQQLQEALIVNPYDVVGVGEALQTALRMRLEERKERWTAMFERLMRNNVQTWQDDFLKNLDKPSASVRLAETGLPAA
jgi:trehalose 6-phosphate synthase